MIQLLLQTDPSSISFKEPGEFQPGPGMGGLWTTCPVNQVNWLKLRLLRCRGHQPRLTFKLLLASRLAEEHGEHFVECASKPYIIKCHHCKDTINAMWQLIYYEQDVIYDNRSVNVKEPIFELICLLLFYWCRHGKNTSDRFFFLICK